MSMIFFTFRAQTGARKGALILSRAGISARVGRTPSGMAEYGCGYGIWVSGHQGDRAAELLRSRRPSYERSYLVEGGRQQEVFL